MYRLWYVLWCKFGESLLCPTAADHFWMVWAVDVDQLGNPPLFFQLWNSISQGPRVVSLRAISSTALMLSSAASLGSFLSPCLCFHPPQHTPSLPPSFSPSFPPSLPASYPPSLQPLHLCVQGSSEACSWLRPPLLWAKDSAGGQGSGSSLKKSRQIKDKKYWGRKK